MVLRVPGPTLTKIDGPLFNRKQKPSETLCSVNTNISAVNPFV